MGYIFKKTVDRVEVFSFFRQAGDGNGICGIDAFLRPIGGRGSPPMVIVPLFWLNDQFSVALVEQACPPVILNDAVVTASTVLHCAMITCAQATTIPIAIILTSLDTIQPPFYWM